MATGSGASPEDLAEDKVLPAELVLAPDNGGDTKTITQLQSGDQTVSKKADGFEQKQQSDSSLTESTQALVRQPADEKLLGETVASHYKIIALLGKGGMGKVYKAHDEQNNRLVALKTILPHLVENDMILKRFQREAESVGALQHENIAQVYECGFLSDGAPFIAMEYIEGSTLTETIKEAGHLNYDRAVPIFCQIADALEHAHRKGVLHRDLKPSNVLVRQEGGKDRISIVDFGMAKLLPEASIQHSTLTNTGDVFGSPPYMSPEQCQGLKADQRSDIYAFGCLMYETLTGRPPLLADTAVAIVLLQLHTIPPPMMERLPGVRIPEKLEREIIFKTLRKDPNARQQSMAEVQNDLRSFLSLQEEGLELAPAHSLTKVADFYMRHKKISHWSLAAIALISIYLLSQWWEWIHDYRNGSFNFVGSFALLAIAAYALYSIWRENKKMNEVKLPTPVWQLAWQTAVLQLDAETTAKLKAGLQTVITNIESGRTPEDRNSQEYLRMCLEKLESVGCIDDIQFSSTHAVELLRKQGRENHVTALLFKEFLADSLLTAKNFERAETLYRSVLDGWQEEDAFSSEVRCTVQLKLADSNFFQERFAGAESIYSAYLARWDMLGLQHDEHYALRVSRLGDCYCALERFKLAEQSYINARQEWDALDNRTNRGLAFVKYAYSCFRSWKPVEITRFEKEVETVAQGFGKSSIQNAAAMSICSTFLWKEHKIIEAEKYRREADSIITPNATRPGMPRGN